MRKRSKHPAYSVPAAGEAQKDIVTKNKPQSKKTRDKLTEPDHTPVKDAPVKFVGHPRVADTAGEAYKDLSTKDAYALGFEAGCEQRGVDPAMFKGAGVGSARITMRRITRAIMRALSNKSGLIHEPHRAVDKLEGMGVPAEIMLDKPGKGVFTSEKSTRKYLADVLRDKLPPGQYL